MALYIKIFSKYYRSPFYENSCTEAIDIKQILIYTYNIYIYITYIYLQPKNLPLKKKLPSSLVYPNMSGILIPLRNNFDGSTGKKGFDDSESIVGVNEIERFKRSYKDIYCQ